MEEIRRGGGGDEVGRWRKQSEKVKEMGGGRWSK